MSFDDMSSLTKIKIKRERERNKYTILLYKGTIMDIKFGKVRCHYAFKTQSSHRLFHTLPFGMWSLHSSGQGYDRSDQQNIKEASLCVS